ncbi:Protein kinase-like protein [Gracilaria domingensis]|nr:Protein kinase-like protein [Gracilaria domingensis]
MEDQGEPVSKETRREDFSRLLIELGKLQVESMRHIEALKDAGVRVESSKSLIAQTKILLAENVVQQKLAKCEEFKHHLKDGLADVDVHVTALYELLREFYDSGKCPLSLTHGDLIENVLKDKDGALVVFDWGEARIDVPLCDTKCFEDYVTPNVMDEYLSLWEAYAQAFDLKTLLEYLSIQGSLAFILQGYEGDGTGFKRIDNEHIEILAWLLVKAKEVVDKKNL